MANAFKKKDGIYLLVHIKYLQPHVRVEHKRINLLNFSVGLVGKDPGGGEVEHKCDCRLID